MLKMVERTHVGQAGVGVWRPTHLAPQPLGAPAGTKRSILTSCSQIGILSEPIFVDEKLGTRGQVTSYLTDVAGSGGGPCWAITSKFVFCLMIHFLLLL